jgi:hypothetical protein
MDATIFKGIFPEFSATNGATIAFFITVGEKMLNADRWGDSLEYGLALFVAHHLAISGDDMNAAAMGATPGALKGFQTSKSVDKVSVSYDGTLGTYEGAGFWNQTRYGVMFFQQARMIGAGGYQV